MGKPLDSPRGLTSAARFAGCGAVCSAGRGAAALDAALAEGRRAIGPCPRFAGTEFEKDTLGFVAEEDWAALRGAYPDRAGDPAFLLAAGALDEAMREAEAAMRGIAPERIALVLSTTKADIEPLTDALKGASSITGGEVRASGARAAHLLPHELARSLAEARGARGPAQCVSAACASGLVALMQGARMIQDGHADAALVVGVDHLSPFILSGFRALRAVDPAGCRPFDRCRAGMTPGEAGAAAVLVSSRRLSDSGSNVGLQSRPTNAAARIAGWGSSNDANHMTAPSRDGGGMALAIRRALAMSGAAPGEIDWIHAHATATPFNDAMESLAYRAVFGEAIPPVAASKGIFGHTFGAAGLLETIACLRAVRLGIIPATAGLAELDPAAPARVVKESQAWNGSTEGPRRVLKASAGFGGINAAIVLRFGEE